MGVCTIFTNINLIFHTAPHCMHVVGKVDLFILKLRVESGSHLLTH